MKLEQFIKRNDIPLSKGVIALSNVAIEKMRIAKDAMHDDSHVENLFDTLDVFLKQNSDIRDSIKFDVLVLSICWHDTWKSTRDPKNRLVFWYDMLWDGIGSSIMFKKSSARYDIPKEVVSNASYAIRRHGFGQMVPRKTFEAKLLKDLDRFDKWNIMRLRRTIQRWLSEPASNGRLYILSAGIKILYEWQGTHLFYNDWFSIKAQDAKEQVLKFLRQALKDYRKYTKTNTN